MRVLIFATDILPCPNLPTSGTALRTFGFKSGFEALGCQTRVCVPKMAFESTWAKADSQLRQELQSYEPYIFDHTNSDLLVYDYEPDLIYCGHWPAAYFKKRPNCPVVIDLAGPHLLERFYQGAGDHAGGVIAKLNALADGDLFIVSGEKQRGYFESFLLRAGITEINEKIILAPMALPPVTPLRSKVNSKEMRFLFAGIFLPWQDPSVSLKAIVAQLDQENQGELRLIGGTHPTYPVPNGVYESLFETIEKSNRVSRSELLPIEELNREMLEADVAVDLMAWNLERELAVTIRTTTYLWSGLPVIYNDFSDLSELIQKYNAGWTINPTDDKAIRKLVSEIISNPSEVKKKSENAFELARIEFSWEKHAAEILKRV